jgi:hypothetical protein
MAGYCSDARRIIDAGKVNQPVNNVERVLPFDRGFRLRNATDV